MADPRSPRLRGLCGCWNAINYHPPIDLRGNAIHGTPGHAGHVAHNTAHAWCETCSPGSIPVYEKILGRKQPGGDHADPRSLGLD